MKSLNIDTFSLEEPKCSCFAFRMMMSGPNASISKDTCSYVIVSAASVSSSVNRQVWDMNTIALVSILPAIAFDLFVAESGSLLDVKLVLAWNSD